MPEIAAILGRIGIQNQDIDTILREITDFLEIQEVEYKPRAYRTAARNIESLSEGVFEHLRYALSFSLRSR